jgi:hypothetical protein
MKLRLNNILLKYHLINSLLFVDGEYSVSRELKIKLIRYKFNFQKYFNEFNEIQQKYSEEVQTDEYKELVNTQVRTEEQDKRLTEVLNSINGEYNSLINEKLNEEIELDWYTPLTEDEFNQLLEVNVEHSVNINGTQLSGDQFVSLIHDNLL